MQEDCQSIALKKSWSITKGYIELGSESELHSEYKLAIHVGGSNTKE